MSTKVDAVCLALTSLWEAALTEVQVVDSAQVNSDPTSEWLFVGHDGNEAAEDTEVISAQQEWMAFGKVKKETAEVTCAIVAVNGAPSIPAVRARANSILSSAEDALRADMTLGGLVMQSLVSELHYYPIVTSAGAKVRLTFTVTYQAQL